MNRVLDVLLTPLTYAGPIVAMLGAGSIFSRIDRREPADPVEVLVTFGGAAVSIAATELVRRRKHRHSGNAHGFIRLDLRDVADAKRAQIVLSVYSRTTKWLGAVAKLKGAGANTLHIDSIDHLDQSKSPVFGPSGTLLVEFSFNPHPPSQQAHDTIMRLAQEIAGLAGAPGASEVWCCVSDM